MSKGLETLVFAYMRARVSRGELVRETSRQYESRLLDFARSVDAEAGDVKRKHVERWMERDGLSVHYRRARLSALRGFTEWCVLNGHMDRDPCTGIKLPRLPELLPRYLSTDEMEAVMAACSDTRTRLAALLMVQELLRRGEVGRLQIGDIDLGKRTLSIRGKGGRGKITRREPISDETFAALRVYLAETRQHAGPLFRSRRDVSKPVSGKQLGEDVTGAMKVAGVKQYAFDGRSPHALRHTGAQDLADAGVEMRIVQKALGHKSIRSTEGYVRGDVNGLREAMAGRTYASSRAARC